MNQIEQTRAASAQFHNDSTLQSLQKFALVDPKSLSMRDVRGTSASVVNNIRQEINDETRVGSDLNNQMLSDTENNELLDRFLSLERIDLPPERLETDPELMDVPAFDLNNGFSDDHSLGLIPGVAQDLIEEASNPAEIDSGQLVDVRMSDPRFRAILLKDHVIAYDPEQHAKHIKLSDDESIEDANTQMVESSPLDSLKQEPRLFTDKKMLYERNSEGPIYVGEQASDIFSLERLEILYEHLVGRLNWNTVPKSFQVLKKDPEMILEFISDSSKLNRLLNLKNRDQLIVTTLLSAPGLLDSMLDDVVFSTPVYFTFLYRLQIRPEQIHEALLPKSILDKAKEIYRAIDDSGIKLIKSSNVKQKKRSLLDASTNTQSIKQSDVNERFKKKQKTSIRYGLKKRSNARDPLINKTIHIPNIHTEVDVEKDLKSLESVGYDAQITDDLTLSSELLEALHSDKREEIPDLNCGGVHFKYALPSHLYAQVSQSKRALECFKLAAASLEKLTCINSLVQSSSFDSVDQLTISKFVRANLLPTVIQNTLECYKKEIKILPENKRSYIASNKITIHYPKRIKDDLLQCPGKNLKKKHVHFVMAYREAKGLYLPELDELGDALDHEIYFVLTQDEMKNKWEGQFPEGYGAIVLDHPKDKGISQRRFAALAAARQLIDENRVHILSLQDDNVSSVLGFQQTLKRMLTAPAGNKHELFTFPNRRQPNRTAITSGKLIVMHADTLGIFSPVDRSWNPQSGGEPDVDLIPLLRLIPPADLFYEDVWLLRSLIQAADERSIRILPMVNGHLNKSNRQQNMALDCFATNEKMPLDFWADEYSDTIFFNDKQGADKALFYEFREHLIDVRSRIMEAIPKINKEARDHVYNQSLVLTNQFDHGQEEVSFWDYQTFFIKGFKDHIYNRPVIGPTASHVDLLMATSSGKTYTFIKMVEEVMLPSVLDPFLPRKRCIAITPKIELAQNIIDKVRDKFPKLAQHARLVCTEGLSTDIITHSTTLEDDSLFLVMVQRSLKLILDDRPDFLNLFDLFILDESDNYKHNLTNKILATKEYDKMNGSERHRILIKASATPNPNHLEYNYFGDRQLIANFSSEAAHKADVVRKVEYIDRRNVIRLHNWEDPETICKLIHQKIKQAVEYKDRHIRVICYVDGKDFPERCAKKYNEMYGDLALASAYHRGVTDRHRAMNNFKTFDDIKKVKLIFAIDMLKVGSDIDGGVDFLFNTVKSYLSPEMRSQIIGRAFRLSLYNEELAAKFFDYSSKINEAPTFYQEQDFFQPYVYSSDNFKARMLLRSTGSGKFIEKTINLDWEPELRKARGFPNLTGNSCFVSSALHHLRHRLDVKTICWLNERGVKLDEQEDVLPFVTEPLLKLIKGFDYFTDYKKMELLTCLKESLDVSNHVNYDNLRMDRQQDVSEFTSFAVHQLGLELVDGTFVFEYSDGQLIPSEKTCSNVRHYYARGSVAEVDLAMNPGAKTLQNLLQEHFSDNNLNNYFLNDSRVYSYNQQVLYPDQLSQLTLRLKRFDVQGQKLRNPIELLKPFIMNFPVVNIESGTLNMEQPIILVRKKVIPLLINVHEGLSRHEGHHLAYEPTYDKEDKLVHLKVFNDEKVTVVKSRFLEKGLNLSRILENTCMVLVNLTENF